MTPFIKTFIEKNIALMEEGEWEHVFLNWYNIADDVWPDDSEFDELINILTNAKVDVDMNARYSVLFDEIDDMIEGYIKGYDPQYDKKHISCAHVASKLRSQLGYVYDDIEKIIVDVATKMHLIPNDYYGKGFTWK